MHPESPISVSSQLATSELRPTRREGATCKPPKNLKERDPRRVARSFPSLGDSVLLDWILPVLSVLIVSPIPTDAIWGTLLHTRPSSLRRVHVDVRLSFSRDRTISSRQRRWQGSTSRWIPDDAGRETVSTLRHLRSSESAANYNPAQPSRWPC
jgi:hypothetical protein